MKWFVISFLSLKTLNSNVFCKFQMAGFLFFADGIIISAATTPHEMFDILFRVQGSKLSDAERPRNLIGGLVGMATSLLCIDINR